MQYLERRSTIAGAVLWRSTVAEPVSVLPDGCMDLLSVDGRLVFAGSDTRAVRIEQAAPTAYAGLRFSPGVLPTLMHVSARELRDSRVPLEDVLPPADFRRISEELAEREEQAGRTASSFERVMSAHVRRAAAPRLSTRASAVTAIAAAAGSSRPVASVADDLGYSERQLHRICVDSFGYGFATLNRVLRFQRASAAIGSGVALIDAASRFGYADQSHMTRDFTRLSGRTPGSFAGGDV